MNSQEYSCGTVKPSVVVAQSIYQAWEKLEDQKVRSQSRLYRALFCDIAQHFPNFVLDDFRYLLGRLDAEGSIFYLDKLPYLGRAFECSLISLEPLKVPEGWKLYRRTRLPKFLKELFSQLFHDDGSPRFTIQNKGQWTEEAYHACKFIRQACMMYSKVEYSIDAEQLEANEVSADETALKCVELTSQTRKAFEGFLDRVSKETDLPQEDPHLRGAVVEARRLLRCVLEGGDAQVVAELKDFEKNPWGRHGPGAVAGHESGCEKWNFQLWPGLPRRLFDWVPGLYAGAAPLEEIPDQPPARVCAVPKDFRGPRIICIEPKENQFAQQGLMDILYRLVRKTPLTRRSISFLETERSRELCYDDKFATIDLKDASDLISLRLARTIFPRWFFRLVTRYRSRNVIVPDLKRQVRSRCLATMGNATCFPLETLVFWALSLGAMITIRDSFPFRQRRHLNLDVRVFGDDIIVPLWAADNVCRVLETCGLAVNSHKTCIFSPVRESCGEWVIFGRPIRVFRLKTEDVTDYRSWLQWRDQISDLGSGDFPALQQEIQDRCAEFIGTVKYRYNKKLQRMEVLLPTFVQLGKRAELRDMARLYAWHVRNDRTPFLKGTRKRVKMRWHAVHVSA